jgi:hypothetical protein
MIVHLLQNRLPNTSNPNNLISQINDLLNQNKNDIIINILLNSVVLNRKNEGKIYT